MRRLTIMGIVIAVVGIALMFSPISKTIAALIFILGVFILANNVVTKLVKSIMKKDDEIVISTVEKPIPTEIPEVEVIEKNEVTTKTIVPRPSPGTKKIPSLEKDVTDTKILSTEVKEATKLPAKNSRKPRARKKKTTE